MRAISDPIPVLQAALARFLKSDAGETNVEIDGIIDKNIGWRPHVFEAASMRAWYLHAVPPDSDTWAERAKQAVAKEPTLRIGVACADETLRDEELLKKCEELDASISIFRRRKDSFVIEKIHNNVLDVIYEKRLKLSDECSRCILDESLSKAISASDSQRKGVLLELLLAVLFSQVDGFEVQEVGVSNRTQQMDILVHNRNVGGGLSGSPVVLVEAKNWKDPVDPVEYAAFLRKLESRHGRSKLGYFVTTGRFTSGVSEERRRDSMTDKLVVLIDGTELPTLWNSDRDITRRFEEVTLSASVGS